MKPSPLTFSPAASLHHFEGAVPIFVGEDPAIRATNVARECHAAVIALVGCVHLAIRGHHCLDVDPTITRDLEAVWQHGERETMFPSGVAIPSVKARLPLPGAARAG